MGGVPLREWPGWTAQDEATIGEEVRDAAYRIIAKKGATNHAIGVVTAALLRWSLRGTRRILTIARVQDGAAGIRDLAISLPTVVGHDGAVRVLEPSMDSKEREAFERSAEVLREALRQIEI